MASSMSFTQWLARQEHREGRDVTGDLAALWRDHSPGRVSSARGVLRHVKVLADLKSEPGVSGPAEAALAHWPQITGEYEDRDKPLHAIPDTEPDGGLPDDFPRVEPLLNRVRAEVAAAQDGDDPAQSRLDAILGQLQAVRIVLEDLVSAVGTLSAPDGAGGTEPDGDDWAAAFELAGREA